MSNDKNRGGYREGGGRPATDRNVAMTVRISQKAADKQKTVKNKLEFIDRRRAVSHSEITVSEYGEHRETSARVPLFYFEHK